MASNTTTTAAFSTSQSPTCTLIEQEPLLPWVSDNVLAIILPTIVYAIAGAFFHLLDTYNLFSTHRIHPSEDELKRNHVTKWECLKSVVRYHAMQISLGLLLNYGNNGPPMMVGDEACRIHDLALRFPSLRNVVPMALMALGIDARQLSIATQSTSAKLAHFVGGGGGGGGSDAYNPTSSSATTPPAPSTLSLHLAKFLLTILIPGLQYTLALIIVDTWIYFTHRLCHVNKTLYRLVHAQHHRLYVSYAYGAVYAHWLETLFLDILSFVLAGEVARLSARQSMVFGAAATWKTISDHCGYVFPWDPLRWVNGNGAGFHDLHHQSWGLKYNFSAYTVFWDNLLGTTWADQEGADKRYRRVRDLTEKRSAVKGEVVAGEEGEVVAAETKEE